MEGSGRRVTAGDGGWRRLAAGRGRWRRVEAGGGGRLAGARGFAAGVGGWGPPMDRATAFISVVIFIGAMKMR